MRFESGAKRRIRRINGGLQNPSGTEENDNMNDCAASSLGLMPFFVESQILSGFCGGMDTLLHKQPQYPWRAEAFPLAGFSPNRPRRQGFATPRQTRRALDGSGPFLRTFLR